MGRVVTREELRREVAATKAEARSVALANGVFDVLHVGHARYLQGAARQAHVLVVAVNSDESVQRLKGPGRPVQPEDERAELVAALAGVDFVTIFAEPNVEDLLRELRPDVHCKGTDYTPETLPERAVAKEVGARIAIVGDPKDHDSSTIIRRIADGAEGGPETVS